MILLLDLLTTVCIGLLIGTEFAVSVFINPILWRLEPSAQGQAIRFFARRLGTAMPFWYVASLLLLIGQTLLRRHESGLPLLVAASAIWAVVIVLTLLFLVPINNRMMRISSDAPLQHFHGEHKKWDSLHRLRVVALTASLVAFLVAVRI
jgi:uncharacterized membrane protein